MASFSRLVPDWRVAALLFFLPLSALAATTDEIFALYAKGDYEQAERAGEASHTAPGLAIAARSQLVADFPLCNKSFGLSYSGNDL